MQREIKYQDKIKVDFDLIFPPPTDEQFAKERPIWVSNSR